MLISFRRVSLLYRGARHGRTRPTVHRGHGHKSGSARFCDLAYDGVHPRKGRPSEAIDLWLLTERVSSVPTQLGRLNRIA